MSIDQDQLFVILKKKIETIISLLEESEQKRTILLNENMELTEKLKVNNHELEELKRRNENLRLAGTILGSEGNTHDAKLKVNMIVREIDKCIALLNN